MDPRPWYERLLDRDNPVAPVIVLVLLVVVIVFIVTIGGPLLDGLIQRPG
ncbi:MAG TPA: hypothetical protein VKZ60_11055 [Chloroflexota bacterium]|nr:hypothetical protein [Chloroflexota bacterium]